MKFNNVIKIVKPNYIYFKLTPNNSIRNNSTYKIGKVIASLYKSLLDNVKKEEVKLIRAFGKDFLLGTKYSIATQSKVSYFIYIEKKKVEFYFIIPKHFKSIIKEKITDTWDNITVSEVAEIPKFKETATKYQMVYSKEDALSLAVDRRNNELLESSLNIIDVLDEGDKVGLFYNFTPISQYSWKAEYHHTVTKIKNGLPVDRNKFGFSYIIKSMVGLIGMIINDLSEALVGLNQSVVFDSNITLFENVMQRLGNTKLISDATTKKGLDVILNTQILALSESESKLREINNIKSLTQSFNVISEDNGNSLIPKKFKGQFNPLALTINGVEINKISSLETSNFITLAGRDLLEKYNFIEKIETQETEVPEELRKGVMCIGTNVFRGHKQKAYLSNDQEYKYLTLVLIAPTRAGKSTLIGNISRDAINNDECVIMFDFIKNCELSSEVASLFPKEKTLVIDGSDFSNLQGLGYNEVQFSTDTMRQYDNAKKQSTQFQVLINSINADDKSLPPKMERYLTSASLVVFLSGGSIGDVFNVLQNHKIRHKYIKKVPHQQMENMAEYIENLMELDVIKEIKEKGKVVGEEVAGTKISYIVGILDRLHKLKANTYMELMLKKDTSDNINLVDEMQKNQLIVIKMPEAMFTTDNERDVCTTYWITKVWLSLQIRGQLIPDRNKLKKVNLVIDELYQVENTERFLKTILSRLAKFSMKPIISCHYLNQIKYIREELRSANASYMLISGCDKMNFNELKSELYPFVENDLIYLPRYNSINLIKYAGGYAKFITELPKPIV